MPHPALALSTSAQFSNWLAQAELSLGFTTYQTNRLFFVGSQDNGRLAVHERLFDKPMGLYQSGDSLYMSTRYQLWHLQNQLQSGEQYGNSDRLYVPRTAHTTGDINTHDVIINAQGQIVFVNTDFSCLATLNADYSFEPLWHPVFISKLVPEDRCHLNGVAMVEGQPKYVTACSSTDTAAGWRNHRTDGGVVIDVESNEIIASRLSMPHSPRWYRDRLWVLNSGTGEFGSIDITTGQFAPLAFCPGFVRGLAFWKQYAVIGLSKLRSRSFTGLKLEQRLQQQQQTAQCGLAIVDLDRGEIVHWLKLGGAVEELFDIVVLPGVRQPQILGLQNDDIQRLVTFPGSGGLCITKPTAARPGIGAAPPVAGLPTPNASVSASPSPPQVSVSGYVKYQSVFHLNVSNCQPYDAFTFPSLQQRWQTRPPQGELIGISASIEGTMVGLAIAELKPSPEAKVSVAELLSLFVLPECRQKGIGTRLVQHLEAALANQNCTQVQVNYRVTELTQRALEPMFSHRHWAAPEVTFLLGKTSMAELAKAPWVHKTHLPQRFTIFPWTELTEAQKQQMQQTLNYPTALNPFGRDSRIESLNSLALREGTEVVGWMLTHRVAPDTIRYSTMFVAPRLQRLGRGVALMAEAIKRQINSPVPYCAWSVAADNLPMMKFLQRRLAPYTPYLGESRQSTKLLI